MLADTSEPMAIRERLRQHTDCLDVCLRGTGYLDYLMTAWDGHLIAVERKEVHDLSNRVDDLENQLKRAVETVGESGEVILLREGIMLPADSVSTILYRYSEKNGVFYRDRLVNRPYTYYEAFIYRLDKLGIMTYTVGNQAATVEFLAMLERKSKEQDYSTFRRYIRKKIRPAILDPQVQALVNLGVSADRAEKLIAVHKTAWKVLNTKIEELTKVENVGKVTVQELFKTVGKRG